MSTQWQPLARIGFLLITVSACLPAASAADPVRITVDFTVGGSPQDPDFGLATSSGSFSVVTTLVPGPVVLRRSGFGADELSFSWAGASWTTANADVESSFFCIDVHVEAPADYTTPRTPDLGIFTARPTGSIALRRHAAEQLWVADFTSTSPGGPASSQSRS